MTEVNLKLDEGDKVSIEKAKPSAINYLRIGNGKMNKTSKLESVDLIQEMTNMTKPELKAIGILIKEVPWEVSTETGNYYTLGIVHIRSGYFSTKAERLAFQKGLKILRDKDLVRKNGTTNYMLNPKAVIPTALDEAIRIWNTLQPRTTKEELEW